MAIQVRCPECGATLQTPAAGNDRLAAEGTCPLCGSDLVASLPATPASAFRRSGQLLDEAGQTVDALETLLDGCDAIRLKHPLGRCACYNFGIRGSFGFFGFGILGILGFRGSFGSFGNFGACILRPSGNSSSRTTRIPIRSRAT